MSENLLSGLCTQRRFRSDCTIAQSDQNPHWAHGYFENRIPLKPALGSVCSLANYSVAYGETQSNRVSDFRDFVRFLFPKAILFVFLLIKVKDAEFHHSDNKDSDQSALPRKLI